MTIRPHYDIRISESHRQMLLTALSHVCEHPTRLGADQSEFEEWDMLKGMLDDVTDEARDADVLHDFTL